MRLILEFFVVMAPCWAMVVSADDAVPGDSKDLITNSIGMKLNLIPTGSFLRGATRDEEGLQDEKPQRKVTITKSFYIGSYEVTQREYRAVMNHNPSHFKDSDLLPVENVSWYDAVKFCIKLSERDGRKPYYKIDGENVTILGGKGYRLPTEAEWEYACRAPQNAETPTKHPFGSRDSELSSYAWSKENSGGTTHPVGQKKPNRWGLYDMQGNVWEWCQDWYAETYYAAAPETDPMGPSRGSFRVNRGGSWFYFAVTCRPASRVGVGPGDQDFSLGFRVAADE